MGAVGVKNQLAADCRSEGISGGEGTRTLDLIHAMDALYQS